MKRSLRPTFLLILLGLTPSTASAPRPVPTATAFARMEIVADRLDEPVGVAVDQAGTIFVSEAELSVLPQMDTEPYFPCDSIIRWASRSTTKGGC